jgi:hypothetical protein
LPSKIELQFKCIWIKGCMISFLSLVFLFIWSFYVIYTI